MIHKIHFNGTPVEKLEKPELLQALDTLCTRLDELERAINVWKSKYEQCREETKTSTNA